MTKTICDRCGKDIFFLPHCIETNIFFKRHEADLCKECYQELLEWLKGDKEDESKQNN